MLLFPILFLSKYMKTTMAVQRKILFKWDDVLHQGYKVIKKKMKKRHAPC